MGIVFGGNSILHCDRLVIRKLVTPTQYSRHCVHRLTNSLDTAVDTAYHGIT